MTVDSEYLNMPAHKISNDFIELSVLKDFGAKIASIRLMEGDFELLAQPSDGEYKIPEYMGDFSMYDTSGADDCIPTIDTCNCKRTGSLLPDHGDVWSKKFDYRVTSDGLVASVGLESLPIMFTKTISLNKNVISLKYDIYNKSDEDLDYLYAFHGLLRYEPGIELGVSDDRIINVIDEIGYEFDYKKLDRYPDGNTYKFYFDGKYNSFATVIYNRSGVRLTLDYDSDKLPYLGVWFTKGGFKGEYNFALEPSNGFYDSLKRAQENGTVRLLPAKFNDSFEIRLILEKF